MGSLKCRKKGDDFRHVFGEENLTMLLTALENHLPSSSQMFNVVKLKLKKRFKSPSVVELYMYDNGEDDPWADPFVLSVQQNIHSLYGIVVRVPVAGPTPQMMEAFDSSLDWDKVEMFCAVCQHFLDNHLRTLFKKHGKDPECLACEYHVMEPQLALSYKREYTYQDGQETIHVHTLSESNADQVMVNYEEWGRTHSPTQVKLAIRNLASSGAYVSSKGDVQNESLASFAVLSSVGLINILYTETPFRRRGFGIEIVKSLSRKIAEMGLIPRSECTVDNDASRQVQLKTGFKFVGLTSWVRFRGTYPR